MKKMLFMVAALGIGWATQGCKKENFRKNHEPQKASAVERVKSEDGVLIFENEGHLYDFMEQTTFLSREERSQLENKLNFQSLFTIEGLVHEIEDIHQTNFYGDIDPSLSLVELRNMGMNYDPSEVYKEYNELGIIEYINDDNSVSLELIFEHVFYKTVVGLKNRLIVGDKLYVFEKEDMKVIDLETNEVIAVINANLKNGNGNQDWHKGIGIGSCCRSHYRELTSDRRVRSYIEFKSNFTSQEIFSMNMFWVNQAQEKKWGSWQIRDSYKPIWGLWGTWQLGYQIQSGGNIINRGYGNPFCSIAPNGSGIGGNGMGDPFLYNTSDWSENNIPPITMKATGNYPASQYLFFNTLWYRALQESNGTYYVKVSGTGGGNISLVQ